MLGQEEEASLIVCSDCAKQLGWTAVAGQLWLDSCGWCCWLYNCHRMLLCSSPAQVSSAQLSSALVCSLSHRCCHDLLLYSPSQFIALQQQQQQQWSHPWRGREGGGGVPSWVVFWGWLAAVFGMFWHICSAACRLLWLMMWVCLGGA
jgi:hypothetical protein